MKKYLLLFIMGLLLVFNSKAQKETWYRHYVLPFPRYPNLNSVALSFNYEYPALVCGDSGFVSPWVFGVEESWFGSFNMFTNKKLNSVVIVDSSNVRKAYIVGQSGKIFKTNSIPSYGNIPFYPQQSSVSRSLNCVYFPLYSNGVAVGDTGTVVRTTDGGSHWSIINSGTSQSLYAVHFPSLNTGYAVGSNGAVIKTIDNGQNWALLTQPTPDTLRSVWFTSDNTGFVVCRIGGIYKTTNGGTSWQVKPSGTTKGLNSVSFVTANTGYIAGNSKTVLKTTNAGETWNVESIPSYFPMGDYKCVGVNPSGFVSIVGYKGTAIGNYPESGNIFEKNNENKLIVYPNPSVDKITVIIDDKYKSNTLLTICNLQGQILLQQSLTQSNTEIDLSQLQLWCWMGLWFPRKRL
jgi:photosystem II stability/assembly factor-like uncharacterized protein